MDKYENRLKKDAATIVAIIKYLLIFSVLIGLIYFGLQVFYFSIPLIIGLILAKVSATLAKKLIKFFTRLNFIKKSSSYGLYISKWNKTLLIGCYVFILLAFSVFLFYLLLVVINEIKLIASNLPYLFKNGDIEARIIHTIDDLSKNLNLSSTISDSLKNSLLSIIQDFAESLPKIANYIVTLISNFLRNLPMLFMQLIIVIVSGYYFLIDSPSFYRLMFKRIPNTHFVRNAISLINNLSQTLFRVIGGYLFLLIVTFIEALVTFSIIKLPYAITIAMIAAFLDFLPILGIGVTMVPVALYFFFHGQIWQVVVTVVAWVIITIIRRFLEPVILGNAMKIHTLMILLSMIAGITIYGLGGVLLGPIIFVVIREIIQVFSLGDKIRVLLQGLLQPLDKNPDEPPK